MRRSSNSSARGIPTFRLAQRVSKGGAAGLILVLVGLGSALCYAAALIHFPLLAIYARPIQNLEKLTNADPWTGLALTVWTLLLFVGYAVGAVVLAQEVRRKRRSGEAVRRRATNHPRAASPFHRFTLIV